jgi:polyphosphate kinase 2 (PPK2 family)
MAKMKNKEYEGELRKLQADLVHLQEWIKHEGQRVIIVFEGRDTAGKGGTIRALTERVSPRVFRVVALPAPSDREKTQMYLQRYVEHFPPAGEVVIFDRSWYNRAGIEHVMGFCTKEQYESFLTRCPLVEKSIVGNGIQLIKLWLEVGQDEQERRRPPASRIPSGLGSCRQWLSNRGHTGTTIRGPAIGCSRPPTRSMRPGTSCARTTSAVRGSTA